MTSATTRVRLLGASAAIGILAFPAVTVGAATVRGGVTPPSVPAALQVPAGNAAYLVGHATGVQIYTCAPKPGGAGFGWTAATPNALLVTGGPLIRHYAGPTWLAPDGSYIRGASIAGVPSTRERAVPWLLLRVVARGRGYAGGATLSATTYVQRLNTVGGQAPQGSCDAATAGVGAAIPYTADYYFYRAMRT